MSSRFDYSQVSCNQSHELSRLLLDPPQLVLKVINKKRVLIDYTVLAHFAALGGLALLSSASPMLPETRSRGRFETLSD
jgi:hypothetical protein